MEIDPTRMCELLVGLGDVDVLGVDDPEPGRLVVRIAPRQDRPCCYRCGTAGWVKDHRDVDLVDLGAFNQHVTVGVIGTRWWCPRRIRPVGSWTPEHPEIAPAGHLLTTRAGRWATEQVGRYARTVSGIAEQLGLEGHTVNDAVVSYGDALLDADTERIGQVRAPSSDETFVLSAAAVAHPVGVHPGC